MYECPFPQLAGRQYAWKGLKLKEVLEQMGMVVEGVRTTKAAYQLAQEYDVPMPITTALYDVLFNDKEPKQAVDELMIRMKRQKLTSFAKCTRQISV